MRVRVSECYDNPEDLVIRKARNDYENIWVGDYTTTELIERFKKDDESHAEAKERLLIKTLLHKGHFGPFEHPQISFEIEGVSRALMAQITRHRVGITFDIQSQRYVDFGDAPASELVRTPLSVEDVSAPNRNPDARTPDEVADDLYDEAAIPDGYTPTEWLERNRQMLFREATEDAVEKYNTLRKLGVPPEDARFVLPIGSKVNITTSMNLRTLMHIADMRAQADAQWEIAELTEEMLDLAEEWAPISMGYYREEMVHRKNRLAP